MGQICVGVGIIRSPPKRRRGGAVIVVGRPPKRQRALTEAFKSPVKARWGTYISAYRLQEATHALHWHLYTMNAISAHDGIAMAMKPSRLM